MESMKPKLLIERDVLDELDLELHRKSKIKESLCKRIDHHLKKKFSFSKMSNLQIFEYFFPIILWIRTYKCKKQLKGDIISGLTVGIMQISQGLAYGELAGITPIAGLYVSLIPCLIYAIFGTSRYVHLGTFAVVSLMVSSVMNGPLPIEYAKKNILNGNNVTLSNADTLKAKFSISATLTISVGLIQLILCILNGGIIAKLLSPTVVHGFTFAVALQVFSSQVPTLLGIKVPISAITSNYGIVVQKYIYLFGNICSANVASVIIWIVAFVLLVGISQLNRRFSKILKIPIPGDLLVIIIATGLSYGCKFNQKFNVPIVGSIPAGLPSVTFPDFTLIPKILPNAIVIAIVTFAVDVSIGKQLFSQREMTKKIIPEIKKKPKPTLMIRPNQELLALGLANIFSSFFQCYVAGSSLARSVVHANIGHSQLFSCIASSVILMVLLFASGLFYHLPKAILAAVVISALVPVFLKITQLKIYWNYSKRELFIWIITVLSVFLIGIEVGLAISVLISLLSYLYSIMMPSTVILGSVTSEDIYKDSKLFNTKNIGDNIAIMSFKCPLFYLNNERFTFYAQRTIQTLISNVPLSNITNNDIISHETCLEMHEQNNTSPNIVPLQQSTKNCLILDFSSISFVDFASYEVIRKLITYADSMNTVVYICCASDPIYLRLKGLSINFLFPTIHDAVLYARSCMVLNSSTSPTPNTQKKFSE